MSNITNELQEYVNSIRQDLNRLYDADFTEEERETLEEQGEAWDLYSYFDDALDIEYTIGSQGDYRGVRIAVALGGPNVYVDTLRGEVVGYWGTDTASAWIASEICDEINAQFEDLFECVRR